jgi:hypothetical protein
MLKMKNNELTKIVTAIKNGFLYLYKAPIFLSLLSVFLLFNVFNGHWQLIFLWLFIVFICYGINQWVFKKNTENHEISTSKATSDTLEKSKSAEVLNKKK